MDVFESASTAALLGVTFARLVQTPTDTSLIDMIDESSDFEFSRLAAL